MSHSKFDISQEIPVMEHFETIQGEGCFSGKPAYFIRTAGCDVGCTWCDVKESWETEGHPVLKYDELISSIKKTKCEIVVVTGGEPAMYDLQPLTEKLKANGYRTHIETSGAYPLTGDWDWICVSPKRFKRPVEEVLGRAHELKTVIVRENDFRWNEKHVELVSNDCQLLLQPEWDARENITPAIIDYVKEHPRFGISLQTHKYLRIP